MNNQNYENHPEGDWDDRGEILWNETDWRKYLDRNDVDITRFLGFYDALLHHPMRIDQVAHLMGWDSEDWSVNDVNDDEFGEEEDTDDDLDPYTILKHPVILVSRALYQYLFQTFQQYMDKHCEWMAPRFIWSYSNSLHEGQTQALLSIQALDMGDFSLAVCHIKNSLKQLNQTLSLLNRLPSADSKDRLRFQTEAQIRIFDLREVWLRVLNDCRAEAKRRYKDLD